MLTKHFSTTSASCGFISAQVCSISSNFSPRPFSDSSGESVVTDSWASSCIYELGYIVGSFVDMNVHTVTVSIAFIPTCKMTGLR